MRGKYILFGGVASIVGIFLLFYGGIITSDTNIGGDTQLGKITQILGGILLIVGMCFMFIGSFIPNKKIKSKPPYLSHDETQNNIKTRNTIDELTKDQSEQMKKNMGK